MAAVGGGGQWQSKTNFADSEEFIFQFSAKSDNIYYVYLQSSQNPSLIPPLAKDF